MAVINVSSRPIQVSGAYQASFLVNNPGTVAVYLGTNSSLAAGTQDVTLNAGASCTWQGELWAVSAGAATSLEVALSSGGLSAPAPGTVQVSGPVSVNGAVSVPGGVGITGGAVQANQQSNAVLIDSVAVPFPAAAVTALQLYSGASQLNVAPYASVLITITQGFSGTIGAGVFGPPNYISADILSIGGADTFNEYMPQWLLDAGMKNSLLIPVTTGLLAVNLFLTKIASTSGGTVNVRIYGLSTACPAPVYVSNSNNLKGSIPTGGAYLGSSTVNSTEYVASKNGPGYTAWYGNGAGAGSIRPGYAESGSGSALLGIDPFSAGAVGNAPIFLPMRPALMNYVVAAGTVFAVLAQ